MPKNQSLEKIILNIFYLRIINMKTSLLFILFALALAVPDWTEAEKIIHEGIDNGLFSGCVLGVVSNNSTFIKKAYGTTSPKRGFYAPPMQANYKFDINRLTQVIGVNSVLMQLYDQVVLNITKRIVTSLPDFNNNNKSLITVDNMLQHNSGFPADYNDALPLTPAQLLKKIQGLKLDYALESKFQYSEIGLVVLGHLIQKVKNQTLKDAMFQILTIAGMRDTGYIPTTSKDLIVPGGYNKGVCQGIPFNKYARFLNNIAGNAGIFSTVDNMANYMQVMLNKGKLNITRVFSEEVVNLFTSVSSQRKYKNTYAKGWETVPAANPPCGKKFSTNSFGLADTSGSYVWADKQKNVAIVFLANGNFPAPRKDAPTQYLGRLSDSIMTALGY